MKSWLAWCLLLPAVAGAQAGSWRSEVAPFPVADAAGPLAMPFLGGYDVPRPQLVDIDGDGDLDLFLQEQPGRLTFFERDGAGWRWITDRWGDLDVGDWYRFVDLEGDGDMDLLGESRFSHIAAWRNDGTRQVPRFTLAADTLRDAEGTPIFADRQNILTMTDIDGDGFLDLFIGRVEGIVVHYRGVGRDAAGLPLLVHETDRWEGIEIIGGDPNQQRPGPSLHGANTMAFADVDRDGDLDLLWGDFFEPGLLLIENVGTRTAPNLRVTPKPWPVGAPFATSGYNAPAPGDVDGDGDLDVVVGVVGGAFGPSTTGVENLLWIEQTAPGAWRVATRRLIRTLDVGNESLPVLGDLDGDGDLDLLLAQKIVPTGDSGSVEWFENVGTRTAPSLRQRAALPLGPDYHQAPALGDLDGDGLPDLVVGSYRDRVRWYRNTGTRTAPAWTLADSVLVTITRGSNTAPALGDLDGDGDLDLLVGESSGQLNLYRNVGTRTAPRFELVSDAFQGIDPGRRSAPLLVDLDGDGVLDLLLGAEDGTVTRWRNASTATEFRFIADGAPLLRGDNFATPAAGDLDGDGRMELLVGGMSGGIRYYRR